MPSISTQFHFNLRTPSILAESQFISISRAQVRAPVTYPRYALNIVFMKRILVTGGTGLVGNALQRASAAFPDIEIIPVNSKDADLRDCASVRALFEQHTPLDGIIHCAANVGGLFKNMREPVQMLEDNLLMNTNVLREAHAARIQNVVCVLSTCIFPDAIAASGKEMTSADLHEGPPHPSNEGYAYAKRMMEVQCRAYQRQFNRRYICIVPTNIYGPHDNFDLQNAHVIPALIHKAYLASITCSEFTVGGDGTPLRQFIFADDLATLILRTYLSYTNIDIPRILCPPDSEVSIGKVAEIIAGKFDILKNLRFDPSQPNGQARKTVCPTDEPGMMYTSIEEGLGKAIDWFLANNISAASSG